MPGPLTVDDLLDVWRSNVDPEYARQVEADPDGFALVKQAAVQFARVSLAVDRTTQAMYFLAHSSQSNEPATGARLAIVTMQVSREFLASVPLTFDVGFAFEQRMNDYGPTGPVEVFIGRRYLAAQLVTIGVGQLGPLSVVCSSEFPGFGYNEPRAGTITFAEQVGVGRNGTSSNIVVPADGNDRLEMQASPDAIVPEQIGQYVVITSGTNLGQVRRIVGYEQGGSLGGSVALLARTAILRGTLAGTFNANERVEAAGVSATLLSITGSGATTTAVLEQIAGVLAPAVVLTGSLSGATFTISVVEQDHLVAATGISWRVLSWADDFGLGATNTEAPTGGRNAMLDEIAADREPRSDGDTDATYARRATRPSDKVTPNAVRRAINRALAPYNRTGTLREPGLPTLPGFFADVDFCDYDPLLDPALKWKVLLSFLEFRAFMVIEVPRLPFGEFGMACDEGFTDSTELFNFCDGFAVDASKAYAAVKANVEKTKAGGVGFELVVLDP